MSVESLLGALIAIAIFVYLIYTLLCPERF